LEAVLFHVLVEHDEVVKDPIIGRCANTVVSSWIDMLAGLSSADSDEAGRVFRFKAATHSDLKAATIPM
jgi:hypothetical protein